MLRSDYDTRVAAPPPRWLDAVADPVRLAILRSLSQVEAATVAQLTRASSATTATTRRHLEALLSAGVVAEHPGATDGLTVGRPAARFSLVPEVRNGILKVREALAGAGR